MIDSVARMAQTTIALIFACVLGVSGLTRGIDVRPGGLVIPVKFSTAFAFGGTVFIIDTLWKSDVTEHELGHLAQEDLLGVLYLPIIGIPSVIHAIAGTHGWPETWADELGGQ